ncbi:Uncharacterised protein [uncultured archaeon]|nr:Uncharacterised protein [uncultured archaeon]
MVKSIMNKMKQKKENVKNPLKWIAVSGFVFAVLILIFNVVLYSSLIITALKSFDLLFFVQFIFSNNILFGVLFVLMSIYLLKANKFARVLWVVISSYFVVPAIPSLVSSFSKMTIFTGVDLVFNLYLIFTSLALLFWKTVKERFK